MDEADVKTDLSQIKARPAAPLPTVNPWEERKKKIAAPTVASSVAPSDTINPPDTQSPNKPPSAPLLQFGSVDTSDPISPADISKGRRQNSDGVTIATAKKQRKSSAPSPAAAPVHVNTALWPDVGQAAEVARIADEKKEKTKEKKDSETSTSVDESTTNSGSESELVNDSIGTSADGSAEKPKWTAIPADELQAAADDAAEAQRRQAVARRKAAKAGSSTSPARGKSRKMSIESRKGRSGSASSGIRLPPMPGASTEKAPDAAYRPVFGTVNTDTTSSVGEAATSMSAPLSRQTSRQSRHSPRVSRTQLPSPAGHQPFNLDTASIRLGAGPFNRANNVIPPHPLPAQSTSTPPTPSQYRPSRSRDQRQSFSGLGGRGGMRGFRPTSLPRTKNFASPPNNMKNLPDNMYARGYGMGYGFVPQPAGPMPYGSSGMYDAWAGQLPQHGSIAGGLPPPPMPQTMVFGLDPLRVYVLGQVST